MARFGRTKTHAPIIRHGRIPPPVVVTATFALSYEATTNIAKADSQPYEVRTTIQSTASLAYESIVKLAGAAIPYDSLILSETGLRAYWPLDETAGTVADDLKATYDGTYSGGYTLNQAGAGSGTGKSVNLGTTGYIQLPSSTPDLSGGGPATFEAWARTNDYTINQFIYGGYENSPFNGFGVQFGNPSVAPGKIAYWSNLSPSGWVGSTGLITDTNWHHIVVVYDSGFVTFYIDGVAAGTVAAGAPTAMSSVKAIGSYFGGGSTTLNGGVDAVALYDVALSAAQVLNHYNNGNQTVSVGATFSLPYEAAQGTVAVSATFSLPYEANIGVSNVQPYSNLILGTSGLLDYWRLNETVGNMLDSKGANPGTTVGAGITRGVAGLIDGDVDKAISGAGAPSSTSYINIPASASMDVTTQLTVEAWVKPSSFPAGINPNIINRGQDHPWYIRHYTDGRWEFNVYDSANVLVADASNSPDLAQVGVRQHVVMTYDSVAGMKGFINGKQVASKAATANPNLLTGGAVVIGDRSATWGSAFAGTIDEVALYNVALTQQQIYDHFNAGSGAIPYESRPPVVSVSATFEIPLESLTRITDTDQEVIEANVGISDTDIQPIEARTSISATFSLAYESRLGLAATTVVPYEANLGVSAIAVEPYEARFGLAAATLLGYESNLGISAQSALSYEAYSVLAFTTSVALEALIRISDTDSFPYEATVGTIAVSQTFLLSYESNVGISDTDQQSYETTGAVSAPAQESYESLFILSDPEVIAYEALVKVIDADGFPYEATVGTIAVSQTFALAYEANVGISATTVEPIEAQAVLSIQTSVAYESLVIVIDTDSWPYEATVSAIRQTFVLAYESNVSLSATYIEPVEANVGLAKQTLTAYESLFRLSQTISEPIEANANVSLALAPSAYEILLGLTQTTTLPFEAQQKVNVSAPVTTPYEILLGVALAAASNPYESLLGTSSDNSFPYESYVPGFVFATIELSIESVEGLALPLDAVSYEVLVGGIRQTISWPYEGITGLSALTIQPLESLSRTQASAELSYETLIRLAALSSAPVDIPGSAQALFLTQYEALLTLAQAITLPYEIEHGVTGISALIELPLESLVRLTAVTSLPYEYQRDVLGISALIELPIESLGRISLQRALAYESLIRLAAATSLPYEYQHGTLGISALVELSYDSLFGTRGIAILPIESIVIGSFPGHLHVGRGVFAVTGSLVSAAQNGGPKTARTGRIRRSQTGKVTK